MRRRRRRPVASKRRSKLLLMERFAHIPGTSQCCCVHKRNRRSHRRHATVFKAKKDEKGEVAESKNYRKEADAFLKAVWYGAEGFGDILASFQGKKTSNRSDEKGEGTSRPIERREVLQMLRDDYDKCYFISGLGEMSAYDPNCTFADPFVSFNGVDRFKKNVGNLGSLMQDVKLEITDWREGEESVQSKWRFSCILDLPWRPRLAAAGGTTHVFDERTGKVVEHIEDWDIEPGKVVRDLLRPSSKTPTNRAEAFFLSWSKGDAVGIWKASAKAITVLSISFFLLGMGLDYSASGEIHPPLLPLLMGLAGVVTEARNTGYPGGERK